MVLHRLLTHVPLGLLSRALQGTNSPALFAATPFGENPMSPKLAVTLHQFCTCALSVTSPWNILLFLPLALRNLLDEVTEAQVKLYTQKEERYCHM